MSTVVFLSFLEAHLTGLLTNAWLFHYQLKVWIRNPLCFQRKEMES